MWRLLACGFLLVAAAACTVNPVTGTSQLDLMGETQELALGASMHPGSSQQSRGPIEKQDVQRMVTRVGESVARVSHGSAVDAKFTTVKVGGEAGRRLSSRS